MKACEDILHGIKYKLQLQRSYYENVPEHIYRDIIYCNILLPSILSFYAKIKNKQLNIIIMN